MRGVLQAAFRPDAAIRSLRVLARHRAERLRHRAPHIVQMPQAMGQMHIQLSEVLSDSTGVTGQAIVRAMGAGERDAAILAQLRNPGCTHTAAEITKALTGSWHPAQIFMLAQHLQRDDVYTAQLATCAGAMAG